MVRSSLRLRGYICTFSSQSLDKCLENRNFVVFSITAREFELSERMKKHLLTRTKLLFWAEKVKVT